MATTVPYLLGGKTLQGVQSPDQPAALPDEHHGLVDIESCIDDPAKAPLGQHVLHRHKPSNVEDHLVHISKKPIQKEMHFDGLLVLRRRGMETNELEEHLEKSLPPLAQFLEPKTRFQGLFELDISRNRLSRLPDIIGTLQQLRILNVSSNLLTTVPEVLYNLPLLKVLVLSQNQINIIPAEMSVRLPHLITLQLAGNCISEIKCNMGLWRKMRHLQFGSVFGGNRLTSLPDAVTDMISLEELDLSHNQLRALPASMAIRSLLHLNVCDNQLSALPNTIALCHQLRTLNVSKNHLTTLPADLVALCHLQLLDVSENLLCIIPADILERMRTTLLITGNPLTRPNHCDTTNSDAYTKILQHMILHPVPRTKPSPPPTHDHCGPYGIGCEGPSTTVSFATENSSSCPLPPPLAGTCTQSSTTLSDDTITSQPRYPLCEGADDDADIDRVLLYHARQLHMRGSRSSSFHGISNGVLPPTSTTTQKEINAAGQQKCDATLDEHLTPGSAHFVHSLRELAARALLRYKIKVPEHYLPESLTRDLSHKYRLCVTCQSPFVNEWVTSVQVKSYKGHPAVVRRVRFCSRTCWQRCLETSDPLVHPGKHAH